MQIFYDEGPPSIGMGAAGVFERGVSRDIDSKLAEQILKKKSIVFTEGEKTKASETPSEAAAPVTGKKVKEAANGGN